MPEPKKDFRPAEGGDWVYCKFFIHWRSKKPVYRKNGGWFRFPRRR